MFQKVLHNCRYFYRHFTSKFAIFTNISVVTVLSKLMTGNKFFGCHLLCGTLALETCEDEAETWLLLFGKIPFNSPRLCGSLGGDTIDDPTGRTLVGKK